MILLSNKEGIPFQIDDADYFCVSQYEWSINNTGYPTTRGRRSTMLHIFLFGRAPIGLQWDHINRDKYDCRRQNLRIVTVRVNQRNVGLRKDNTSGIIGVQRHKRASGNHCWKATIKDNSGKQLYLGLYDTIEAAAVVRQQAEVRLWGVDR